MATVTINTPEPVTPPSTITVEMTVKEAAYVAALLGHGNEYETFQRAGVDIEVASMIYFRLHDAVTEAGGADICARLSRAYDEWDSWRRRG